jgi:hypothetical protein
MILNLIQCPHCTKLKELGQMSIVTCTDCEKIERQLLLNRIHNLEETVRLLNQEPRPEIVKLRAKVVEYREKLGQIEEQVVAMKARQVKQLELAFDCQEEVGKVKDFLISRFRTALRFYAQATPAEIKSDAGQVATIALQGDNIKESPLKGLSPVTKEHWENVATRLKKNFPPDNC